ncbi:MAG: hypothetical protein KF778_09650 [Rhodocyclaceae bacterium]|nr:hypothetical protein [Rhodocyclaceae bacterium]MBX3668653.1 hypothetical protein [Rhodocyclaceae bacterium]
MMSKRKFALALALALGIAGCTSTPPEPTYQSVANSEFVAANYLAADMLIARLDQRIRADQPLIAATVVNIDSLEQSSTLGRVVSEQIAGRFAQRGYRMVEMKFRNSVYMKRSEGELVLTRELSEAARTHNAQAVVLGTYAQDSRAVYLNMKVVQPGTNLVLAVYDYVLPMNEGVKAMLGRRA